MKRYSAALAAAALGYCAILCAPADAGGADALGRFLGTWQSPGTLFETPYSKAGSATATTTCSWSDDRVFLICQQRVLLNGKADDAVSIYTYDADKARYRFYHLSTAGVDDVPIALTADTVTYTSTFNDKGRQVTVRTLNVWDTPDRYRWRTEYSADGGKTWTPMAQGTAQKRQP